MCVHIFDPGPCIDFSTELGMQSDCEASTGHGTGNSPLLNKWRKRCELYGNKLDEFQLIKFLAKDMDVKMRKNDPIILMVEMNTCYLSKVLISMASNKRGV